MADSDRMARDRRITAYLPKVRLIANRVYQRAPLIFDREDLYAAGCLTVVKEDPNWDPAKGRYVTYMQPRVFGGIIDHLRCQYGRAVAVRISDMATEEDKQAARQSSRRERRGNQIDRTVQFSPAKPEHWADAEVGLYEVPSEESLVSSKPSPLDALLDSEAIRIANKQAEDVLALEYPNRHCRQVLAQTFFEGITMKQIGKQLGVTESRVSQIRTLALNHARKHFAAEAQHG